MISTTILQKDINHLPEGYAELWTELVRNGYDLYRDNVNTPAFFEFLPDVKGKLGLDVGCGEGFNTRLLSQAGAVMSGIDISPTFVKHASNHTSNTELKIQYSVENAVSLSAESETFDFATSFFSLLEIADLDDALSEIYRILKPDGFFQFSIMHPCFNPLNPEWVIDDEGKIRGIVTGNYFSQSEGEICEWIFDGVGEDIVQDKGKFKTAVFRRTLSDWINQVVQAGFKIEKIYEPCPSQEVVDKNSTLEGTRVIPYFLIIRVVK